MEILNGGAWIAAVAAPWAVAPHPNFSQDNVEASGLLALVARCRPDDLQRYSDLLPLSEADWAVRLIDAAKRSVILGSVRRGADDLWTLTRNETMPVEAAVAAAMFATVAEVELDERATALLRLEPLKKRFTSGSSRTSALAAALLHQQIAARKFEMLDYAGSLDELNYVETFLAVEGEWSQFTVSHGISWNSDLVSQDIWESLTSQSRELRSRIEGFSGETWVKVVKSRTSWPDMRAGFVSASRDRKYVENAFETRIGSRKLGRTFRNEDPIISPALEALLTAELRGDVNEFMKGRESLAQIRILREAENTSSSSAWEIQDGLRLLRQARAKESLKRSLDWISMRGPDIALSKDAELILGRSSFPSDITEFDLLVLSAAAPYLGTTDLSKSLKATTDFLHRLREAPRPVHVDERILWSSMVKLLPETDLDDLVARRALLAFADQVSLELVESDLVRLIEAINWSIVSRETIDEWRAWGKSHLGREALASIPSRAVNVHLPADHARQLLSASDSDLALYLVSNSQELFDVDSAVIARAEHTCISDLQKIRDSAKQGMISFGDTDSAELSTVFAHIYGRQRVWTAVAAYLSDSSVPRELKARALTRFAEYGKDGIPIEAASILQSNWENLMGSEVRGIFSEPDESSKFTEAIRAGSVLHIIPKDQSLAEATELAGSLSPDERVAAAQMIPDIANAYAEWAWSQLLLLQLSRDVDATVRSHASRSLAVVGSISTNITPLVSAALLTALRAGGIRVPLLTLHGLQKAAASGQWNDYSSEIRSEVHRVSAEHPARIIRLAASHVEEHKHTDL
ncbi:hypothetical protein [Paenarthrobacter sp. AMU7]|uniref:Uncharacterized protein n=1 Tax=Paenarthrobacter sp. AMU7 TaxID=3162492 RepID=A0AB39YLZ4_9MICC